MTIAAKDRATGRQFTPSCLYAIYFPACGGLPARLEFRHGTYDHEAETFRTEPEPPGFYLYFEDDRDRFLRRLGYEVLPGSQLSQDALPWWPDRVEGAWRARVSLVTGTGEMS